MALSWLNTRADETLSKGCNIAATAGLGGYYSSTHEPRHPVHITDFYATESRTPLVRELSADRFQSDCYCTVVHQRWVRAGEGAKVCGGQEPLCSAASVENNTSSFSSDYNQLVIAIA